MPKIAKEMSALEVKRLRHPGGKPSPHYFAVGTVPGLILRVTATGARSWLLRVKVGSLRREIGLGAYPKVPLAGAIEKARAQLALIEAGRDPVQEKQAAKAALMAAQARSLTFAAAVEQYMKTGKMAKLRHDWQREEWRNTLQEYAVPVLGKMLVDEIALADVKRVLVPIWQEKNATALKVRNRVESVLAWAIDAGHRTDGTNPASKAVLKQWIADQGEIVVTARPMVPIDRMADWLTAAGKVGGTAAQALRFLALTAVRVDNVAGAVWSEIDLGAALWTIPADRMKGKAKDRREHKVPLSSDAVALLRSLDRHEGTDLVFPSPRGKELTNAAIGKAMKAAHAKDEAGFLDPVSGKPAVPHGLRASFRSWAGDEAEADHETKELALAHKVRDKTQRAYSRGDALQKRAVLMQAWADWCCGRASGGNVVPIGRGAA